jgi:hypothetical protein
MKQMLVAAGWIAFSVLTLRGQATTAPEFEVASVKPADKLDRDRLPFLDRRQRVWVSREVLALRTQAGFIITE